MSDVPDAYDRLEHVHELFRGWDGETESDCYHTLNRSKRDVLLSLWRIDGGTGVDVRADISDIYDGKGLSHTTVYNTLHALQGANLVSKRQGEDKRSTYYQLTDHGKEVLQSGAARFIRD
jgi:DNA-binding PadR family transcriptional regulator